jgi:hypothetical protein
VPFKVEAFDAAGLSGCSAVPKQCEPRWTALTKGVREFIAQTKKKEM